MEKQIAELVNKTYDILDNALIKTCAYFCSLPTNVIWIYVIYVLTGVFFGIASHLVYKYEDRGTAIWMRIAFGLVYSVFTAGIVLVTINCIKNM